MIRDRRRALGWSLAKLAAAAGLKSPAYVLYIESGRRVPSEAVAARLAKALGENPALLVAWARTRSRGDLESTMEGARTLSRLLGEPAQAKPGRSGGASSPRRSAEPPEPPGDAPAGDEDRDADPARASDSSLSLVIVPVYGEGTQPSTPGERRVPTEIESLRIDLRVFPPGPAPLQPFAYRLTAHGTRRVADTLRPGDCVVLSRERDAPMDDAIYAVSTGPRVEIARVRLVHGVLRLLRAAGNNDSDPVHAAPGADPLHSIVGKVVLALRRWL
jgi:transcriptional regulator with XRE-family HTH domain